MYVMNTAKGLWASIMENPRAMMKFHLYATVFWVIMIYPSMAWWNSSVPYLVALSVYAIVTGHFSAWQAARVEVKQDEDRVNSDQ